MSTARKLLAEALQLDDEQRAALALSLMDSLSRPEPRDEPAWIAEIEKRARHVLAGAESGADGDEVIDRIAHDLGL
ncbi:addiction module protein [Polyangium sp. 6x1]|uniref:addiction module protein n=1 Tax=Polyangium sp. 6x1 TaxID=3042689 RepID=UPI0024828CD7|nr:addiction module protein [Polyangium sp. 6x1]MDI1447859.1 addiction module protein [Polyangium sp. 6x1]